MSTGAHIETILSLFAFRILFLKAMLTCTKKGSGTVHQGLDLPSYTQANNVPRNESLKFYSSHNSFAWDYCDLSDWLKDN